jgi:hypothetical protein
MKNNFHYSKKYSRSNIQDNNIKGALEENKKLKMELNQKNNILKDYNSRIKLLQEELYKLKNQKDKKNINSSNNYIQSMNNNFFNDDHFQNNNFINLFFDNIFPRANVRIVNPNFNPGDYEDYYEDRNINNPNIHLINNDNDNSKLEQDIIEQLYPDPDKMTYEQLLELEEKVGNVSKGLNKKQINKIPRFIYNKIRYKNIENKCVVCQYEYKNGENLTKLPCGHIFHTDCVDTWLSGNKICPMCHKEIIL